MIPQRHSFAAPQRLTESTRRLASTRLNHKSPLVDIPALVIEPRPCHLLDYRFNFRATARSAVPENFRRSRLRLATASVFSIHIPHFTAMICSKIPFYCCFISRWSHLSPCKRTLRCFYTVSYSGRAVEYRPSVTRQTRRTACLGRVRAACSCHIVYIVYYIVSYDVHMVSECCRPLTIRNGYSL